MLAGPALPPLAWAEGAPATTHSQPTSTVPAATLDAMGPGQAAATKGLALPSFAPLVDRLLPAVVNISISGTVPVSDGEDDSPQAPQGPDESSPTGPQTPLPHRTPSPSQPSPGTPGPKSAPPPHEGPHGGKPAQPNPLDKFLHDYTQKHKRPGQKKPERPQMQIKALGSGFIIDPSGVIVTNNHVIEDADRITVTLSDGTEMPAQIVGRDARMDLAVLKVTPTAPLPAVPFGRSDKARIGDWVLAIGNPYGLSGTVTAGIVSARGRNVAHGLDDDFIQTDAAINRGNSGGPLFNIKGEVIGINTLIFGGAGGDSIGLGFAIPSDDAIGLIAQIRQTGAVHRGSLGIVFQPVTPTMAHALDFTQKTPTGRTKAGEGGIIASLVPKGAAAKAGLKIGDIITAINGHAVTGQTLPRVVAAHQPGSTLQLSLWREGQLMEVPVTLQAAVEKSPPPPSDTLPPSHPRCSFSALGLTVSVIGPDEREQYGLSDSQRGVLVLRVTKDGTAARRGLREGDVILQVGGQSLTTPDSFKAAIERAIKLGRHEVLLLVQDQGAMAWLPISLEAMSPDKTTTPSQP
ncbi:Do family serine endopeptidase [Formicincola oecophyllae]|uniref:Probable periplasmic serine endoprotease DegP-like n=2 Tax=Formicincola oecophyllae TaxID=2558361 RepID=A0A4Y6UEM2_9PROT|nr:Do family serine endopeptidase [Formicincola oecophyllae]